MVAKRGTTTTGAVMEAMVLPAPEVFVTQAVAKDVPVTMELIGQTAGSKDVEIRARVEGYLESVNFREGDFVKLSDDPEEYRVRKVLLIPTPGEVGEVVEVTREVREASGQDDGRNGFHFSPAWIARARAKTRCSRMTGVSHT